MEGLEKRLRIKGILLLADSFPDGTGVMKTIL